MATSRARTRSNNTSRACARNCKPARSKFAPRAAWDIKLPRFDWFPKTLLGRTLLFVALVVASGAAALAGIARYYAGVASERAYDQLLAGATIQVAENLYVQGGVLALNPPVAALSTL